MIRRTRYIPLLAAGFLIASLSACGSGKTQHEDAEGLLSYPEYTAADYVKLGDYKELTVYQDLSQTEVRDEDVLAYMQSMLVPKEADKKAEEGDTVTIDFAGTVDGKEFSGGTATDYDLTLGSGSFIDGFEDQLVGLGKGDKKTVKATFPEGYPASDDVELAGKEAVFEVTVKAVKQLPEFNDDAISDITGGEYKTIDEYKPVLKEQMQESQDAQQRNTLDNLVIQELLDGSEFTEGGCEALNEWYIEMNVNAYKTQAEANEADLDEFVNEYSGGQMKDEAALREALKDAAAENTKTELVVHAIADKEKITIDDKYYDEHVEDVASSAGFNTKEEFEKAYSRSVIENTMLMDKVLDFVEETVTVKDVTEDPEYQDSQQELDSVEVEAESTDDGKKDDEKSEDSEKDTDSGKSDKKSE